MSSFITLNDAEAENLDEVAKAAIRRAEAALCKVAADAALLRKAATDAVERISGQRPPQDTLIASLEALSCPQPKAGAGFWAGVLVGGAGGLMVGSGGND